MAEVNLDLKALNSAQAASLKRAIAMTREQFRLAAELLGEQNLPDSPENVWLMVELLSRNQLAEAARTP